MEQAVSNSRNRRKSPLGGLKNFFSTKNGRRVGMVTILILLAAIPMTLFLSQQEQDIRQRAASATCQIDNVDVMLVIDTSNSMQGGNLQNAKNAAIAFSRKVLPNAAGPNPNRVAVASFDNNGGLNLGFTEVRNSVESVVNGFSTPGDGKGGTCLECALDKNGSTDVLGAFASLGGSANKRHIIILTDAKINRFIKPDGTIDGSTNAGDELKSRTQALNAMNRISSANPGISVHMVQYGTGGNADWLSQMTRGEGSNQSEVGGESMSKMYDDIANQLMGGTVIAQVNDDVNRNGVKDAGEGPLGGVTIKLEYAAAPLDTETKITDGNGQAIFSARCNRPQTLTATPLQGYEMSPAGSNVKAVPSVPEGGSVTQNFLMMKQTNATSLVCDPAETTITGDVHTMKATLKDKDGNPLANKTIIWKPSTNDIIILTPTPGGSQPASQSSPQL